MNDHEWNLRDKTSGVRATWRMRAALSLVLFVSGAGACGEDVDGGGSEEPQAATPQGQVADGDDLSTASTTAGATTYTEHVRPILSRSCVGCHSDGQIAPFALDSYGKAKSFASAIADATRTRRMPPTTIDNSGSCNTFRDTYWLTDEEIATLGRWAQDGAPEGDPSIPAPEREPLAKLSGNVVSVKTPKYKPSTKLKDDYRCFVVNSPFKEKTFVTGFNTVPGDKSAHHMVVFYPMDDLMGLIAGVNDALEPGPGYTCFGGPGTGASMLAGWTPGGGATIYPDKTGIEVMPGRPLIVQMHYNTHHGDPGEDSTQIDFQTQKEGISPGVFSPVLDLEMNLPPGQTRAEEVVKLKVKNLLMAKITKPAQIYGVYPHMHELGKTIRLTAKTEDGRETCLVDTPRYNFNWQRMFFMDKPVTVGPEDEINLQCIFDTTSRKEVTNWGESTQQEMCVTGLFIKL